MGAATQTRTEMGDLNRRFARALTALHRTPKTIHIYTDAVARQEAYLRARGMPTAVAGIRREHLEAHIIGILEVNRAAYASNRFKSLQQFFRWCVEEGELKESPMARMKPPRLPQVEVPVLDDTTIKALLKACSGADFTSRLDHAIILLLLDSGMRAGELVGMQMADLDLDLQVARVTGKGRKARSCPFGHTTARALDRYLRLRSRHMQATMSYLWIGRSGRLTDSGVQQALDQRTAAAGLPHIHRTSSATPSRMHG